MKHSGFFDCLAFDRVQRPAVEFEPAGDESSELDAVAEVAAFVDRPVTSAVIDAKPTAKATSSRSNDGSSAKDTPLAEAAGFYSSGHR